MPEWTLFPGQRIKRTELHDLFGGSRQGGISPSLQSPNVFLFSDRESGEQHGYIDSWKDDGCFHYTGEGQRGDQQIKGGNRAILEAEKTGRAIRVFEGTGGDVEYQGQFTLDAARPYYTADAPETGEGQIRSVIVFRLRPLDRAPETPQGLPAVSARTHVESVAVEERNTERCFVDPSREPYVAERRESELVHAFKRYMESKGHIIERTKITPAEEAKPLFTDVYVKDLKILVEAKGSTDRPAIRMAIGQLLDYSRFYHGTEVGQVRRAVLLPSLPRKDLLDLLGFAGVHVYYPEKDSFVLVGPSPVV